MQKLRIIALGGCLLVIGLVGCATIPMPPSEATMSIVRSYQNQLESRVASGHLAKAQARELLYTKLSEIQPPLPNLSELLEFRKQIEAQVEARSLTPEQAESRLAARESDMLRNWEEMAAKYAQEQREFGRIQQEQERGFRQQQMPIGGRPF